MTSRFFVVVVAAATLTFAFSNLNAEQPIDQSVGHTKLDTLIREYETLLAEFRRAKAPASAVLQANDRLLRASLTSEIGSAGIDYDQRAKQIEMIAQLGLDRGTVSVQELAQTKAARLDSLLKKHMLGPDSNRLFPEFRSTLADRRVSKNRRARALPLTKTTRVKRK